MRRLLLLILGLFAVVLVVVLARTLGPASKQLSPTPSDPLAIELESAVERFAAAVRIPTVSSAEGAIDFAGLETLHSLLAESFPRVHAQLKREVVGGGSLLYTWPGRDGAADPAILMGHLDVVPPGEEARWAHPPFAGVVEDGYLWGRGTIDDKVNVTAILEAAELLLAQGFTPARTVFFAFGHDEEIGGREGAAAMAGLLAERGVRAELVLDEGMAVIESGVPGIDRPVAFIGVAEKGYVSLELIAQGPGGHSSMPPRGSPVALLARALDRLEHHPLPAHLGGPMGYFLDYLGPEMPLVPRAVFANLWLTRPLVVRELSAAAKTNALIRTTTAPTMLEASPKDNVLPTRARAVVNFRIHPQDNVASTLERVRKIVDDPHVEIALHGTPSEPSAVSPVDAEPFELLQRTLGQVFPEALVAPSLVIGATDARHYGALSEHVYRFTPVRLGEGDFERFHGLDERLALSNYEECIRFYAQLLRNL